MSDRPLTVMIPEPDQYGRCQSSCPQHHVVTAMVGSWVECKSGFGVWVDYMKDYMRPGPGCPQYKEADDE